MAKTYQVIMNYPAHTTYDGVPVEEKIVKITFLEEVSGLTAGQACVIYDNNNGALLGGAIIYKS